MGAHLHDGDRPAHVEAVDRFMDGMRAHPGRSFGQLHHRFFRVGVLAAVHAVGALLPAAPEVRLETAPGGHLRVLTGRAAKRTTWAALDALIARHGPAQRPAGTPLRAAV